MNRTEYIGKLNALYVGDKNCLEELITAYDEKDKEIERLNKRNKEIYEGFMTTTKELTEYAEEIERLNNIINELEKDMIFDMNDYGKDLDIQTGNIYLEYQRGYCQNGKDYYDRLQALKGVDKE